MFKNYLNSVFSLFFALGFLFIPLTFNGLGWQYLLTRSVFLPPVTFIQNHFFSGAITNVDFSSDTIGLNILVCLLLTMAFVFILLLDLFKIKTSKITDFFKPLSAYYIAAVLLKYGFDKIFKQQFYLPEPNILYTNFGKLSKDILFWSTIGTSYSYSLITGIVEVSTALLILARRTRIFGFCLATMVLLHILLINFSFDISVKTFTSFLLAVVVFNTYPYLKNIYLFFVRHKQAQLMTPQDKKSGTFKWTNPALGVGLICCTLYPYILTGNFDDDHAERPFLHGAYNIVRFIVDKDTLQNCNFPYKRLFIHRNGYIIFQQQNDEMIDYFFEMNPTKKQLELRDYKQNKIIISYSYQEKTSELRLEFNNNKRWVIESKSLNWRALPALQNETHYTIDEIK